jgi:hypothetical protein
VIAPLTPPVEAKVNVPFDVPPTPNVGVTVQLEAETVEVFGIAPAEGALVAFVPPKAIVIVGKNAVVRAVQVGAATPLIAVTT